MYEFRGVRLVSSMAMGGEVWMRRQRPLDAARKDRGIKRYIQLVGFELARRLDVVRTILGTGFGWNKYSRSSQDLASR